MGKSKTNTQLSAVGKTGDGLEMGHPLVLETTKRADQILDLLEFDDPRIALSALNVALATLASNIALHRYDEEHVSNTIDRVSSLVLEICLSAEKSKMV